MIFVDISVDPVEAKEEEEEEEEEVEVEVEDLRKPSFSIDSYHRCS